MWLTNSTLSFLSIKCKTNFIRFGRLGKFKEQRYRKQFEKQFNFLDFNKNTTIFRSVKFAIAFHIMLATVAFQQSD